MTDLTNGPRIQGGEEDDGARKDANEVLQRDGVAALRYFLGASKPIPIQGLYQFSDFKDEIWAMYRGESENARPISTGWPCLDEFYTVVPGELTIVTGAPAAVFCLSSPDACTFAHAVAAAAD